VTKASCKTYFHSARRL